MTRIIGHRPAVLNGTILPGGTLSSEIDTGEYGVLGLIAATSFTNGTITFRVSNLSDAEGGAYVSLKNTDGDDKSFGPVSGTFALTGDDLSCLAPYRYVRIESSIAQSAGVSFILPVKG
ncbi:MAG: hypothetical protein PHO55_10940 [Thiomonas arsenitoxydans]|nr:hypothetical protein [Thiomonas arsenitoxydans]